MFVKDLNSFSRRKTIEVKIGDIPLGGDHPVRIQSMTNTSNKDIPGTVSQIIKIYEAGADYIRLAVPSLKDIEYLEKIKLELTKKGMSIPLIADVHFNPTIAEKAASIVEKVRINPGNYSNEKEFRDKFIHLINICRKNNTAIRIGVNHGSLAERIKDKFGDTPEGMVESAMEFLRICKEQIFNDVVVSMKASNTRVMIYSTRLLAERMKAEDMYFPLHLGVTEAGEGEDGRIKSAVGIGTLLADGIGDTIRVSLTEAPENEIPVAKKMIHLFHEMNADQKTGLTKKKNIDFFNYKKREIYPVNNIGGKNVPVVIAAMNNSKYHDLSPDLVYSEDLKNCGSSGEKGRIVASKNRDEKYPQNIFPLLTVKEYCEKKIQKERPHFIQVSLQNLNDEFINRLSKDKNAILVCISKKINCLTELRKIVNVLMIKNIQSPVIFKRDYSENNVEDFQLRSAFELGGLFVDGLGDGLWLSNAETDPNEVVKTAFGILQASRVRMSKTEYISCPSCARTLFNIQDTLAKIRVKTSHLKNLKIGVMGCIVNGPGEMADADYGYVGSGKGKISLYKDKQLIKRNVPEKNAVDELIQLIKDNKDWQDPLF